MINHTDQSIKINRLKIFIGLLIGIVVMLLAYCIYLYQYINQSKADMFENTLARVNNELKLDSIKQISRYHGTVFYHVVEAETIDNEAIVVFVDQTDELKELIVYSKSDWIADNDIINQWKLDVNYQEIYHIQYGLRDDIPLLEIVYLDQNNRLSYDYYRLENGEYDSGISFANKSNYR